MNTQDLTFTVRLSLSIHETAAYFSQQQVNAKIAKQVYLNTLAVHAVNYYCQCMDIATDLDTSDSQDPIVQTLGSVADLAIPKLGRVDCCTVLPGAQEAECSIADWDDRLGCFAVELDPTLKIATLKGYTPIATGNRIPLDQFQSLEVFLEQIEQLQKKSQPATGRSPSDLGQWLQGSFEAGWQSIEQLLGCHQPDLAFQFRGYTKRGKFLNLDYLGEKIALIVGLKPSQNEPELDIHVEVLVENEHVMLPPDLSMRLLDANDAIVMEAQARQTRNIKFEFKGERGEDFKVQIRMGDYSVTEAFTI